LPKSKNTEEVVETLLSLNLGLSIAFILRVYSARFGLAQNELADFGTRQVIWINDMLHLYPPKHNPVGVELTFVSWIIALSLLAFLFLHFVLPRKSRRPTLFFVGISSLLALPAAILYAYLAEYGGSAYRVIPSIDSNRVWLVVELCVTFAVAISYVLQSQTIWRWAPGIVFVFHCCLWGWIVGMLFSPRYWSLALFAIPFFAGLSWILYVSQSLRRAGSTNEAS
jgi:hypothetical protein